MNYKIKLLFPLLAVTFGVCCFQTPNTLSTEGNQFPSQQQNDNIPIVKKTPDKISSANLKNLRNWIGKCPNNPAEKGSRNLFEEPEFKKLITKTIGQYKYRNVTEHFTDCFGDDLIYEKDGFLVISGISKRKPNQFLDYGLIALNPETREVHIFLVDDQKLSAFSNAANNGTLPIEIKEKILAFTEQSSIIGKIKQKPDEGYICYAVLFDDWDAPQQTRPYVFYTTDGGGRINVEGKDVELKLKNEIEKEAKDGKTYVDWVYKNKDVRAHFELTVSEKPDSSAVIYEGRATVSTFLKTQSVPVKAFCGG